MSKLLAIKGLLQNQQYQAQAQPLEVQERQQGVQKTQIQLQDEQAMTAAMKSWNGKDPDSLAQAVTDNGGSANARLGIEQHFLNLRKTYSDIAKQDAETGQKNLETIKGKYDLLQGSLDNVRQLPDEKIAQGANASISDALQRGLIDQQHAQTLTQSIQGKDPAGIRDAINLYEKDLQAHSAIVDETKKKAETEQAAQGAEAKKQESLWYKLHPEAGAPGVPAETASAADWLAKPENKGKTLSDYNIAMKKIVPAYNFQLQNQGAAADNNGQPSEIAKAIANGQMAWKDAVSMRTPMATKNAILQQVYKLNPNFDTAEFGLEQDAAKKARSGAWADTRLAYNTALDHSDLLLKAADALKNNDFRALNSVANRFKTEFGWSGQINYDAIANAYNHEVGSVVAKGHITDKEVETGHATLPDNANAQTIRDVVNSYKSLMTSKRDELDKIIKAGAGNKANAVINTGSSSGGYAPPANAPSATGPNGHKIVVDGGKWVDAATGKPI